MENLTDRDRHLLASKLFDYPSIGQRIQFNILVTMGVVRKYDRPSRFVVSSTANPTLHYCAMNSDGHQLAQEEYSYIYSKVPRLTVEIVLYSNTGVLMTRRNIDPCRGMWHLPGGTVRFGEQLTEAVERIAKRELGINVHSTRLLGYIEYPSHYEHGLDCPVGIAFEALDYDYDGNPRANDEADGVGWFSELPTDMHAEQAEFLHQFLTPSILCSARPTPRF